MTRIFSFLRTQTLVFLLTVLVCAFPFPIHAQDTQAAIPTTDDSCQASAPRASESGWRITSYQTHITVLKDGMLDVTERIDVRFDVEKHGIYRYIPVVFEPVGVGFRRDDFSLLSIHDVDVVLDEKPVPYTQTTRDSSQCVHSFYASQLNREVFLKIGDPNQTISGAHTYTISYQVDHALREDRGKVELYWNAIPQFWGVPIDRGEVTISGYEGGILGDERFCYTGSIGSTTSCEITSTQDAHLASVSDLQPFQGITLLTALALPRDQVAGHIGGAPWTLVRYLSRRPLDLLPLIPGLLALSIWYRYGRSPQSRGIVAPRYDAPEGISPAQAGIVVDQVVDDVDVSSIIISLATKGYMKIKKVDGGVFDIWGGDYTFIKRPDSDIPRKKPLSDEEHLMYDSIFTDADEVSLSSLKYHFAPRVDSIKHTLAGWAVKAQVFRTAPSPFTGPLIPLYLSLGVLAVIALYGGVSVIYWAGLVISALTIVITVALFKFYTTRGKELQEEVLGLKLYMQTAEKDRITYLNAPEKTPELFERLLPYAMSLGVVGIWADQFTDIFTAAPDWYIGTGYHLFAMSHFTRDLTDASSAFASQMTAVQSSSGSGGGGGGGFSGGGGGGGGGGSW